MNVQNQSINQSINQPINQPTNQPTDQSIDRSINQSISQSVSQINQNLSHLFVRRSVNQSELLEQYYLNCQKFWNCCPI